MDIELKQNLSRIIRTLEGQGMKPTKIAHAIGYTSTRQMYNTLDGKSMLSTKAVKGLIQNLNINPLYLFLGKGDMFLTDESELEILREEYRELKQKYDDSLKIILEMGEAIKALEKRNNDLIDISSAAIKFHQGQNEIEKMKNEPNVISNARLKFLMNYSSEPIVDENGNVITKSIDDRLSFLRWIDERESANRKSDSSEKPNKD